MYVHQVYRIWDSAKNGTSSGAIVDGNALQPNDIWSLFPTQWITDKVFIIIMQLNTMDLHNS